MRYYRRRYSSREWEKIDILTAAMELKFPRGWGCRYIGWPIDMLSVPNRIDCANAELLVVRRDGTGPIRYVKNIRRKEYFEELENMVDAWCREIRANGSR